MASYFAEPPGQDPVLNARLDAFGSQWCVCLGLSHFCPIGKRGAHGNWLMMLLFFQLFPNVTLSILSSLGMPLHAVHTQCTMFELTEVIESCFKPHSAPGINQYHGLWADEDVSGEDEDNDELYCGAFFSALGRL